eukprot:5690757-Pleurochrysis_carterae.AAC.1
MVFGDDGVAVRRWVARLSHGGGGVSTGQEGGQEGLSLMLLGSCEGLATQPEEWGAAEWGAWAEWEGEE